MSPDEFCPPPVTSLISLAFHCIYKVMKLSSLVCLSFVLNAATAFELEPLKPTDVERFDCYFQHSVTVGASVSSGLGVIKPVGELVPELFGHRAVNLAHGSTPGVIEIQLLKNHIAALPPGEHVTSIFAYDTFFWDSTWAMNITGSVCARAEKAIPELVQISEEQHALLILGTIPLRFLGSTACVNRLNEVIVDSCEHSSMCSLRDGRNFVDHVLKQGLDYKGEHYSGIGWNGILIDGLHFSSLGHRILADSLIDHLRESKFDCRGVP